MTVYKVVQGTQIHCDGKTYPEGATVDVHPSVAALWLSAGWVTEVKASAKRVRSQTVEDKAVKAS